MVQSVELLVDPDLDGAVREHWERLIAAGLPGAGRHPGASNRPHVTLAVSTRPWPEPVEAALASAAGPLPLRVRLGGLVVFPRSRECVLARLVVPSPELLALQAAVATAGDGPGAVAGTRPGSWTPHVTLARRLPIGRLGEAVSTLGRIPDLTGQGVAVRRWDGEARREWTLRCVESSDDREDT